MNSDLDNKKLLLSTSLPDLAREFNVESIAIFGSYSRSEESPDSDIDLLVEFSEPISLFRFIDLENKLKNILGVSVDLVTRNALKPRVQKNILKDVVYV